MVQFAILSCWLMEKQLQEMSFVRTRTVLQENCNGQRETNQLETHKSNQRRLRYQRTSCILRYHFKPNNMQYFIMNQVTLSQ